MLFVFWCSTDDKVEDVVKAGAVEALVPLLTLRTELQARDGAGQSVPGCVAARVPTVVKTGALCSWPA